MTFNHKMIFQICSRLLHFSLFRYYSVSLVELYLVQIQLTMENAIWLQGVQIVEETSTVGSKLTLSFCLLPSSKGISTFLIDYGISCLFELKKKAIIASIFIVLSQSEDTLTFQCSSAYSFGALDRYKSVHPYF